MIWSDKLCSEVLNAKNDKKTAPVVDDGRQWTKSYSQDIGGLRWLQDTVVWLSLSGLAKTKIKAHITSMDKPQNGS